MFILYTKSNSIYKFKTNNFNTVVYLILFKNAIIHNKIKR